MLLSPKAGNFPIRAAYLFIVLCLSSLNIVHGSPQRIPARDIIGRQAEDPSASGGFPTPSSNSSIPEPTPTGVCTSEEQPPITCTAPDIWKPCVNGYAGPWQSAQNGALFPTVSDIKTDIERCGNIGNTGPTIFYSFGARTPQARGFRDTLDPKGNMFNDALPGNWFVGPGSVGEVVNLVAGTRQSLLVARIGNAMAQLSKGEVFLVSPKGTGAYTIPLDRPGETPNVWRFHEFPTLQRNSAITKVTEVVNEAPYDRNTGWLPNDPAYAQLPASDAPSQPVPPIGGQPPPLLPPTLPPIPSMSSITLAAPSPTETP